MCRLAIACSPEGVATDVSAANEHVAPAASLSAARDAGE